MVAPSSTCPRGSKRPEVLSRVFALCGARIKSACVLNCGFWQPIRMEHFNDLDFADDVVLFSQRGNDMQNKLDDLAACSSAAGLKVNVSKTKSMAVNTERAQGFTVAGENVEKVDTFQYLGSQIAPDGDTKLDVSTRIKKARGAFAGLRSLWRSNQISLRTKLRIFNSNVKSVLLYGSETWCVSSQNTTKLQVFVNRCLRNIFRAWWPQRPIHIEIRERKWRWIGHTLRKDTRSAEKHWTGTHKDNAAGAD
ncbi:uncharacterized protein LOC128092408 [Culex pipiens pallens]|uniref:uncharacterized protein LOC128092408 n=1 Tax=Culex pipiens pallens TaxID=42434 RepID=UPI0022AAB425|nr:uncharacterized protein LOC128092408 [Culex pipiens pallens]